MSLSLRKLNRFKWTILLVVFVTFLVNPFVANGVLAQVALSDPDDSLIVSNPSPNQYVKNNVSTKFTVVDDDRNTIPYEVSLKNNRCTQTISIIKAGNATSGQQQVVTWPSAGPLQSVGSVADGTYCMEVCATFKKGSNNYSACNSRYVIIRNNNAQPKITTSVPSDRTIYTDGTFKYDVNATDADGDKLTFSLTRAPRFISINSYTGLISTNSNAKSAGSYTIEVKVTDGFGGSDTQKFTLTVQNRPAQTSSSASATSSSATSSATSSQSSSESSSSTSSIDPDAVSITFTSPEAGDQLSGSENVVAWTVEGLTEDDITEIRISLLYDNEVETLETLQPTASSYNFDATRFGTTDYRFQLDIVTEGETFTTQSPVFSVVSEDENPGETDSRPLVINISPEEDSVTTELRPIISGEFVVAEGASLDLDTFELIFNNTGRNWCEVTQSGFTCTPDADLKDGVQTVQIGIQDDQSRQGVRQWTFEIDDPNSDGVVEEQRTILIAGVEVPVTTIFLILAICGALIILLLVPWILYIIWRRRDDNGSKDNSKAQGGNNSGPGGSGTAQGGDVSYLVPVTEQYGDVGTTSFDDPSNTYSAIDVPDYGVDLGVGATTTDTVAVSPEPVSNDFIPSIETTTTTTTTPLPAAAPAVSAESSQPTQAQPQAAQNTDTNTSGGKIDPLDFDNYEDYLAAVGAANANTVVSEAQQQTTTTTTTEVAPAAAANQQQITPPDYSELYTATPETPQNNS